MTSTEITVKNRAGVHARPAALIAQTAIKFKAELFIEFNDNQFNCRSVMQVISMAATYSSVLKVMADGPDEAEAVKAIADLFERRFEEFAE